MGIRRYAKALEELLEERAAGSLTTKAFGPKTAGLALAKLSDHPSEGLTTWVTIGAAHEERSMWRGLPLGHELALTLADRNDDVVGMLRDAVLEDRRNAQQDRRPFIEANGVWAPGVPPHLVFLEEPSAELGLDGRHKLDDRYVTFLAAAPIDDRELRAYDRDPAGFVKALTASGELTTFPRKAP